MVLLATGSHPQIPPVSGLEQVRYWTNRQALAATEAPASLLVPGGGAVGLELAQAFARFGTAVTVVEAMERLLPAEEPEARTELADVLRAEGITVRTAARATGVRHGEDGFRLTLGADEEITGQRRSGWSSSSDHWRRRPRRCAYPQAGPLTFQHTGRSTVPGTTTNREASHEPARNESADHRTDRSGMPQRLGRT